jgi:hypothetical protein
MVKIHTTLMFFCKKGKQAFSTGRQNLLKSEHIWDCHGQFYWTAVQAATTWHNVSSPQAASAPVRDSDCCPCDDGNAAKMPPQARWIQLEAPAQKVEVVGTSPAWRHKHDGKSTVLQGVKPLAQRSTSQPDFKAQNSGAHRHHATHVAARCASSRAIVGGCAQRLSVQRISIDGDTSSSTRAYTGSLSAAIATL